MAEAIEVFFTPNEYFSGYKYIPSLIICGIKPIIWSPSFKYLKAQNKHETFLTPALMIELLEAGIIKIAAREEWLKDKGDRKKKKEKWEFAEWDEYDDIILGLLNDNNENIISFKEADQKAEILKLKLDEKKSNATQKQLIHFYKNNQLPFGQYGRIKSKKLFDDDKIAKQALEDIYNTEDALEDLRNPVLLTTAKSAPVMESIFRNPGNRYDELYEKINLDKIVEFVNLIKEISDVKTGKDLIACHSKAISRNINSFLSGSLIGDKISLREMIQEDSKLGSILRKIVFELGIINIDNQSTRGFLNNSLDKIAPTKDIGIGVSLFDRYNNKGDLKKGLYLTTGNKSKIAGVIREKLFKEIDNLKKLKIPVKKTPEVIDFKFQPLQVFISYKHEKIQLLNSIIDSLKFFIDNNIIEVFVDRKMAGGCLTQITESIDKCHVAIMIITDDFLKSEYITREELPRIFNRFNDKACLPIPILFSKNYGVHDFIKDFEELKIKSLEGININQLCFLPRDGNPVEDWEEEAMEDIKIRLDKIIVEIIEDKKHIKLSS